MEPLPIGEPLAETLEDTCERWTCDRRRATVCYTCGCNLPFQSHGDPRNVVEDMFVEAGKTKEIKNAGKTDAKRNMLKLLKKQMDAEQLERPRENYAEKATSGS